MARRRRGHRDETERSLLLNDDDDTLTDEAGSSTASNEKLRFMVLGGDDDLMDKACATILGERENRDAFKIGELIPRKAQVCGRQVSVLKTPSYWLEHLKSYFFFSKGVKSLKYDLQFFESMMFPGLHAFLLVHRDVKNSGKDNYLLRALSAVFGEEVLDYCMVLFIDETRQKDLKQNSLKMCGGRYHILHNTDESVQQLFKKTETMTQKKNSDFFTNHLECFRRAENYFKAEYKEKENKLRRELNDSKNRQSQLKDDIEKLHRQMERLQDNEKQLKKQLTELTQRDARPSEYHQTSAATAGAELKNIDSSQASGSLEIQKPVRRNSKEGNPPYMSQDIDCDKDQKSIPKTFDKF